MADPIFYLSKELLRYVRAIHRLKGNRTADAAFLEDVPASEADKRAEHLSVNYLALESMAKIADYYRNVLQDGNGDVAVCAVKISQFNAAGKKCGVDLQFDVNNSSWSFGGPRGRREVAYKHRPVPNNKGFRSDSHCGVEFIRVLDAFGRSKFARQLGGRRFHVDRGSGGLTRDIKAKRER